jgi:hypothetical protein
MTHDRDEVAARAKDILQALVDDGSIARLPHSRIIKGKNSVLYISDEAPIEIKHKLNRDDVLPLTTGPSKQMTMKQCVPRLRPNRDKPTASRGAVSAALCGHAFRASASTRAGRAR